MAVLALPPSQTLAHWATILLGLLLTVGGELIRLWAVRQIGTISRTRSDRLGPLVVTGPFRYVRNPLYLGNIALWVGFALTARLAWLAPIILVLLAAEYQAIVRWEERLLEARLGDAYREYTARAPRWLPGARPSTIRQAHGRPDHGRGTTGSGRAMQSEASDSNPLVVSSSPFDFAQGDPEHVEGSNHERFTWRETLFSERGTLLAIAAGYLLLWLKAQS